MPDESYNYFGSGTNYLKPNVLNWYIIYNVCMYFDELKLHIDMIICHSFNIITIIIIYSY